MQIRTVNDRDDWTQVAQSFGAHPMQHWAWGELKSQTGSWTAYRLAAYEGEELIGGAQVLERAMPFPFKAMCYLPRGPFAQEGRLMQVADAVAQWCRENTKAVSVKIDPAVTELDFTQGWVASESVLLSKTATIDLTQDEETLMKGIPNRKCRQYIRKAERDGVVVRPAVESDLDAILEMYHATAEADGFPLHEDSFYRTAFTVMDGAQHVFIAEQEGRPQAFLWNAISAQGTAFELWGAVNDEGKRSRANYYMKWVAILAAKEQGCKLYDLNGLLNDGISDFKLLFVPQPTNWVETRDLPLSPLYKLMDKALTVHRTLNERKNAQRDTGRE